MKTSNPIFKESRFKNYLSADDTDRMTIKGVINKSLFLTLLLVAAGSITWRMFGGSDPMTLPLTIGGAIAGFVLALITIFSPRNSHITVPLYAVAEGLFLGGISSKLSFLYNGIVIQAVLITMATVFLMLTLYRSGVIRATPRFRKIILIATGSIAIVYLINFAFSMFGAMGIPAIYSSGPLGIGISLVIVAVAAFNLVIDFDNIENGAKMGLNKKFEWFAAFGLMVTIIWLYVEILRLLSKLRD